MFCNDEDRRTCNVEKMGCEGCYYNDEFKLCYVKGNKAWFTDNLEKQWGDDWNGKPYERNAEEPYDGWSELIEDNPDVWERKWKKHKINLSL